MKTTTFTDDLPLTLGRSKNDPTYLKWKKIAEAKDAEDKRLAAFCFGDHVAWEYHGVADPATSDFQGQLKKKMAGAGSALACSLDHEPASLHNYLHQVEDENGNVADAPEEGLILMHSGTGYCFIVKMASITDNDTISWGGRGRVKVTINHGVGFTVSSKEPASFGKFDVRYRVVRAKHENAPEPLQQLHGCAVFGVGQEVLRIPLPSTDSRTLMSVGVVDSDECVKVIHRPGTGFDIFRHNDRLHTQKLKVEWMVLKKTAPASEERKVEKKKELAAAYGADSSGLPKSFASSCLGLTTYYLENLVEQLTVQDLVKATHLYLNEVRKARTKDGGAPGWATNIDVFRRALRKRGCHLGTAVDGPRIGWMIQSGDGRPLAQYRENFGV